MNTRENLLMLKFYDYKRFPYGFSRSGDFNLNQSGILEDNGTLIKALMEDQVSNPSEDDLLLKKMITTGDTSNETARVWLKYLGIKHTKISVSSSVVGKAVAEETDNWINEEPFDE